MPIFTEDKMFRNVEKNVNKLRKKMTDQQKRWAPYPAQLRTGQNAHDC